MAYKLDDLIKLADQALAAEPADPATVDLVSSYVEAFELWSVNFKNVADGITDLELGKQLQDKHAKIMRLVSKLSQGTAKDLRNLKVKAKGLLAYTDLLPKQIGAVKRRG